MAAIMSGDCIVTIEMPNGEAAHGKASSFSTTIRPIELTVFGDSVRQFTHGNQSVDISFTVDSLRWQPMENLINSSKNSIEWKCDYCGTPNEKKNKTCNKCGAPRSFIYND